ncbi:MAG: GTP pyrophosphokinase [Eubacteriaceae bacterium]|nr:GTP pyrophosphokinase [Eubacteriaceae bacterium]
MKQYSENVNKALNFAYGAHHGQLDKSGVAYIYHPAYLASQMDTEDEIMAALLHDVIEDTEATLEDLEAEGFPAAVIEAVALLTHDKGTDFFDYVQNLKGNDIARKVKLADLSHNSNASRNKALPEDMAKRLRERYAKARQMLASD